MAFNPDQPRDEQGRWSPSGVATQKARELSTKARSENTQASHREAARAHREAARLHMKAAKETTSAEEAAGHLAIAKDHIRIGRNHDSMAVRAGKKEKGEGQKPEGPKEAPQPRAPEPTPAPKDDDVGDSRPLTKAVNGETATHYQHAQAALKELREKHPDVAELLKKMPLGSVNYVTGSSRMMKIPGFGDATLAYYRYADARVVISDRATPRQWSNPPHNVGFDSPSRSVRQRAVLIHEIGHHVQNKIADKNWSQRSFVDAAFKNANASHKFISKYAKTNHMEYFAETFAAYHVDRERLQKVDPMGHTMVKNIMDYWGKR